MLVRNDTGDPLSLGDETIPPNTQVFLQDGMVKDDSFLSALKGSLKTDGFSIVNPPIGYDSNMEKLEDK